MATIISLQQDLNELSSIVGTLTNIIESKSGQEVTNIFRSANDSIPRNNNQGRSFSSITNENFIQAQIAHLNFQMDNIDQVIGEIILTDPEGIGAAIVASINVSLETNTFLQTEITNRQAGDASNITSINNESATRATAITNLTNTVNSINSALQTADTTLTSLITAETTARTNAITTINNSISTESNIRTATDTTLQANIDTLSTNTTTSLNLKTNNTDFNNKVLTYINSNNNGNNQILKLDNTGKIPSNNIPDANININEYTNLASFPASGDQEKIYISLDTKKLYRWNSSTYEELALNAVTSVNSQSGSVILNTSHIGATTDKNYLSDTQQTDISNFNGSNQILKLSGTQITQSQLPTVVPYTNLEIAANTEANKPVIADGSGKVKFTELPDILPDQTGQADKILKTDGSVLSWTTPAAGSSELPVYGLGDENKILSVNETYDALVWNTLGTGGAPQPASEYPYDVPWAKSDSDGPLYGSQTDMSLPDRTMTTNFSSTDTVSWADLNNVSSYVVNTSAPTKKLAFSIKVQIQNESLRQVIMGFADASLMQGAPIDRPDNNGKSVNLVVGASDIDFYDGTTGWIQTGIAKGPYSSGSNFFNMNGHILSMTIEESTREVSFFWHDEVGTLIFGSNPIDWSSITKLQNATDIVPFFVVQCAIGTNTQATYTLLKSSELPFSFPSGVEYVYGGGTTPGGGISLPISQSDVFGLISNLAGKQTSLLSISPKNTNDVLQYDGASLKWSAIGGGTSVPTNIGLSDKWLYTTGDVSSWETITIPATYGLPNPSGQPAGQLLSSNGSNWTFANPVNSGISEAFADSKYSQLSHNHNSTYYLKNEVYTKTESDANYLTAATLNNYSLITDTNRKGNADLQFGISAVNNNNRLMVDSNVLLSYNNSNNTLINYNIQDFQDEITVQYIKMKSSNNIKSNNNTSNLSVNDGNTQFNKDVNMNSNSINSCNAINAITGNITNLQSWAILKANSDTSNLQSTNGTANITIRNSDTQLNKDIQANNKDILNIKSLGFQNETLGLVSPNLSQNIYIRNADTFLLKPLNLNNQNINNVNTLNLNNSNITGCHTGTINQCNTQTTSALIVNTTDTNTAKINSVTLNNARLAQSNNRGIYTKKITGNLQAPISGKLHVITVANTPDVNKIASVSMYVDQNTNNIYTSMTKLLNVSVYNASAVPASQVVVSFDNGTTLTGRPFYINITYDDNISSD